MEVAMRGKLAEEIARGRACLKENADDRAVTFCREFLRELAKCPACQGRGQLAGECTCPEHRRYGNPDHPLECPTCHGAGCDPDKVRWVCMVPEYQSRCSHRDQRKEPEHERCGFCLVIDPDRLPFGGDEGMENNQD